MKEPVFRRTMVAGLMLALAFLWLREMTMRTARIAADDFIGPVIREMPCAYIYFSLSGILEPNRGHAGPGWIIRYSPYGIFADSGLEVEISILGRVTACNVTELRALIGEADNIRAKKLELFIQKEKEAVRRAKNDQSSGTAPQQ